MPPQGGSRLQNQTPKGVNRLKPQQQFCQAEAKVCADCVAEKSDGDAGADDSLVVKDAAHHRRKGRTANQRNTRCERRVGVNTHYRIEQYMKYQRAKRNYRCENENVGVNLRKNFEAHLRRHRYTEYQDEKRAEFKGALDGTDTLVGGGYYRQQ